MSDIKKHKETRLKVDRNQELLEMLHGRPISGLKIAAAAGQEEAMFQLAHFYLYGYRDPRGTGYESTAQDLRLARTYFQIASNKGHANAKLHLAICYENGLGGTKDVVKALDLYRELLEEIPDVATDIGRCIQKKAKQNLELTAAEVTFLLPPPQKDGSYELQSLGTLAARSISKALAPAAPKKSQSVVTPEASSTQKNDKLTFKCDG